MSTEGSDPFGLHREERIKRSGVRGIFTPHQPIDSVELFAGRQQEVRGLIEHLNTPGQHALLYGDRGVGKSSLANITTRLIFESLMGGQLFTYRCHAGTTFLDVVRKPLDHVGYDFSEERTQRERKETSGKGNLGVVEGTTTREEEILTTRKARVLDPGTVADELRSITGLLVVDEADAISDSEDKRRLAELIKLLSDAGAAFKLLVVGIAETGAELTAAHPSVHRCLKETKLKRMTDGEIAQIISDGAAKINIRFTDGAVQAIVSLSAGYPHFTHLLALKSAEDVIADEGEVVDRPALKRALERAVSEAEGTLKRVYDGATRSYNTDMYRKVVLAAALCVGEEFTAEDLRQSIQHVTKKSMNQQALNNYLRRLVSDRGETILWRMAKGMYRFADPRMRSFIRMSNNVIEGVAG